MERLGGTISASGYRAGVATEGDSLDSESNENGTDDLKRHSSRADGALGMFGKRNVARDRQMRVINATVIIHLSWNKETATRKRQVQS